MLYYIRKYPVSLLIILTVIYLSFFKPPQTEMESIPGIDKVVHVCMYFGMSGMLWLEFIRAHKKARVPMWHAWLGAWLCPVLFSGAVEWRLVGLCCQYLRSYVGIAHWLVLDEASSLFINSQRLCSVVSRWTP